MELTDIDAIDVGDVLTAEEIDGLLANNTGKAPKGLHKKLILRFGRSGEMYLDYSKVPEFANTKAAAIKQSVNGNLATIVEKDATFPKCAVTVTGEGKVLLVNIAVHRAALVARAAELAQIAEEAEESDEN